MDLPSIHTGLTEIERSLVKAEEFVRTACELSQPSADAEMRVFTLDAQAHHRKLMAARAEAEVMKSKLATGVRETSLDGQIRALRQRANNIVAEAALTRHQVVATIAARNKPGRLIVCAPGGLQDSNLNLALLERLPCEHDPANDGGRGDMSGLPPRSAGRRSRRR